MNWTTAIMLFAVGLISPFTGAALGCFITGVVCERFSVPMVHDDRDAFGRWCSWWGRLGLRLGRRK